MYEIYVDSFLKGRYLLLITRTGETSWTIVQWPLNSSVMYVQLQIPFFSVGSVLHNRVQSLFLLFHPLNWIIVDHYQKKGSAVCCCQCYPSHCGLSLGRIQVFPRIIIVIGIIFLICVCPREQNRSPKGCSHSSWRKWTWGRIWSCKIYPIIIR